eukprot:TRINITY_DN12110_c0_g1_i3.p1 TRINITY_DN12110_c0_g1~~TRINITY_DN12110_c0_g1_i3.p1  ORF type:complete len:139 (+),score=25.20 TRINITY_DN12110_c0_g1_i3:201-617(+)
MSNCTRLAHESRNQERMELDHWLVATKPPAETPVSIDLALRMLTESVTNECYRGIVASNMDSKPYIPLERTASSTDLVKALHEYAAADEVPADPAETAYLNTPSYTTSYHNQLSDDDSDDDQFYNDKNQNDFLTDISG